MERNLKRNVKDYIYVALATLFSGLAGISQLMIFSEVRGFTDLSSLGPLLSISWLLIPGLKLGTNELIYKINLDTDLSKLISFQIVLGLIMMPIPIVLSIIWQNDIFILGYFFILIRGFTLSRDQYHLLKREYIVFLRIKFLALVFLLLSSLTLLRTSLPISHVYLYSALFSDLLILLFWMIKKLNIKKEYLNFKLFSEYYKFGKYSLYSLLPSWIIFQSDKLIGSLFLRADIVAVMVVSSEVYKGILLVNRSFNNTTVAKISELAKKNKYKLLTKEARNYYFFSLATFIGVACLMILNIFGITWTQEQTFVFVIYVCAASVEIMPKVWGTSLLALGRNDLRSNAKYTSMIISVMVGLSFTWLYPIIYAAMMQVVFNLSLLVIQKNMVKKQNT